MTRRGFLALAAAPAAVVRSILVHEHVLVDFTGGTRYATSILDLDLTDSAIKALRVQNGG